MAAALTLAGISPSELEKFSRRMPSKIEDALDFPVVKEVVATAGQTLVEAYVHFELMKLAHLVSVGGNLNHEQAEFIAQELITIYPNETLADFKLCFQRGAIGQYGEIFRLDGIVIRGWMEKYIIEKYEVKIKLLYQGRDEMYKPVAKEKGYDPEKHDKWLKKLAEVCNPGEKVPDMSDEQMAAWGSAKQKRRIWNTAGYTYFNVRGVQILAESQEHAERLAELALRNGDLEEC